MSSNVACFRIQVNRKKGIEKTGAKATSGLGSVERLSLARFSAAYRSFRSPTFNENLAQAGSNRNEAAVSRSPFVSSRKAPPEERDETKTASWETIYNCNPTLLKSRQCHFDVPQDIGRNQKG